MNVSKKQIASLIDNVILKYHRMYLEKYINTEDKKFRHDVLISNFSIMFFEQDITKLESNFLDLLDFYQELMVSKHDAKCALSTFFRMFQKWAISQGVVKIDYFHKVQNIYINLLNTYDFSKNINDENDFFFFEDSGVDEKIDNMHYDDNIKIGAKNYFNRYPLDDSDIEIIAVVRDMFMELLDDHLSFSEEFLEHFIHTLQKLNSALQFTFATKEFRDIGYGLEKFVVILNNCDIENSMKEISYHILVAFIEDLIKWLNSIFIHQDSVDIHYLDASLLANVTQFEMMQQSEISEEYEDDFLF